jgi:ABC-type multidrug transport system fused ATPase/permease subunit
MSFQNTVQASQKYFPHLQIKYKDQSFLMKLIGKLLFFNKTFMTDYTTTLGDTIYFPNEAFVKVRSISSTVILLHEIVHIKDSHKLTKLLFSLLYACPQILLLFFIPMLFISWKFALLFLLFALPIPAFFRMYFEKRAYLSSLYAIHIWISKKITF